MTKLYTILEVNTNRAFTVECNDDKPLKKLHQLIENYMDYIHQ